MNAMVREDHFHFDGLDYFRGHAGAVQLGDVGKKKSDAGGHSHLAAQTRLSRDVLHIESVTRIDLEGVTVRGADVHVGITVADVGSLSASTVARLLADETLGLVKLEAAPREVIFRANAAADVIEVLRSTGAAGRLVHQVFVILAAATAKDLSRATRWSLSGVGDDCVLTGIGADGRHSVVVLTAGATFAYLLLKPTWLGKRIVDAATDSWCRP